MLTLPYHFLMKAEYTTLSTKGQIIIPAEIREQMKLAVGTKLSIQRDGQTLILRPITPEFIDSLCGSTKGLSKLRDDLTEQMRADNSGWEKVLKLPEEIAEELINAK